jgi:hypothetical protein
MPTQINGSSISAVELKNDAWICCYFTSNQKYLHKFAYFEPTFLKKESEAHEITILSVCPTTNNI